MSAAPSPTRCAVAARARRDPLPATAGPAQRLMLIELNGPWGHDALRDSRLDRYHSGRLADRAAAAGVRVQLIRRPGRHAVPEAARPTGAPGVLGAAVALADLRPGHEAVGWRTWHEPHHLLEVDLAAPVIAEGPQDVVLVCTHGRHDLCCALDGRPVAARLAERGDADVWETSHLGGERFAANMLVLPTGDLFGGLDPDDAARVLTSFRAGRIDLAHHRGRFGRPPVEQAAVFQVMDRLGIDSRDVVRVVEVRQVEEHRWSVDLAVASPQPTHRVVLRDRWSDPERLTCAAASPGRVRLFDPESYSALG